MNSERFDQLARSLARTRSRRSLLGGTTIAFAAALRLSKPALACKKLGKKCDRDKDCCDGARCKGATNSKKGKCRCKGGFKECNKRCYDLDRDERHCGACGNACVPPNACCNGECSTMCAQ